jgi:Transcriptional regulators
VPDWGPQAFPYASGTTVGHVERVAWAQDAHPIEYSRTWFDYEKVRHISRIS